MLSGKRSHRCYLVAEGLCGVLMVRRFEVLRCYKGDESFRARRGMVSFIDRDVMLFGSRMFSEWLEIFSRVCTGVKWILIPLFFLKTLPYR